MNRQELIEQLLQIQINIETVARQISQETPPYYKMFDRFSEWEHLKEIRIKALDFWKRKFNRILKQLTY